MKSRKNSPWEELWLLQDVGQCIDAIQLDDAVDTKSRTYLPAAIGRARHVRAREKSVEVLERERGEAATLVPEPFRTIYSRLREPIARPWVMGLDGGTCPASSLRVPLKMAGNTLASGEPLVCPSCGRPIVRPRRRADARPIAEGDNS